MKPTLMAAGMRPAPPGNRRRRHEAGRRELPARRTPRKPDPGSCRELPGQLPGPPPTACLAGRAAGPHGAPPCPSRTTNPRPGARADQSMVESSGAGHHSSGGPSLRRELGRTNPRPRPRTDQSSAGSSGRVPAPAHGIGGGTGVGHRRRWGPRRGSRPKPTSVASGAYCQPPSWAVGLPGLRTAGMNEGGGSVSGEWVNLVCLGPPEPGALAPLRPRCR
ncbi:translation initiation factor IF-2-like [Ailuropoda melanoleuca]|uniref:translation initiation factor IF-2-like n=1 Tax=Ailuropoda melanoleuca TaxID=9646 RepID=UPI001493FFC7|nr:translation initiation factor IF-2-like [Ailuropoda melanoleuca]